MLFENVRVPLKSIGYFAALKNLYETELSRVTSRRAKNCNNVISTFLDEFFEAVAVFLSSVLAQWCNEYTKFMYLYAIFWSPLLYQCTATHWWLVQLLECSWTPFPHVLQHFPLFRESALRLFAVTNEINAYCTVRLIMTWINFNASRTLQHA